MQLTARHLADFELYARDFLRIVGKDARLQPFLLNRAQKRVWEMIKEDVDAGRPVRHYWLKARQMGFSTLAKGLEFWLCATRAYQQSLTVAHDIESAKTLHHKLKVMWGSIPVEARPTRQRSNRRELLFAKDDPTGRDVGLQSRMVVQTAENVHLGASMTLQFIHLSEFARYEAIQQDADLAYTTLMQTIPLLPWTFVFIETTAFGTGFGKRHWDDKRSGYRKVFVSWCASDEYRVDEPLDMEQLESAEESDYGNERQVVRHVVHELRYWYPEESKDDEWLVREALCRMAWRRQKIDTGFSDQNQGGRTKLDFFRQEYPITPEEAFLTSGSNVFDTRKLANMRNALYDGETRIDPPEVHEWSSSLRTFLPAKYGELRMYEKPVKTARYVMGADTAEGVQDGDFSAVHVLKLPNLEPVATFEALVDPDEFAEQVYELGKMYNWAFCAAEVNGPGYATVNKLARTLAYPAMYWRETFDNQTRVFVKKYGFFTSRATKPVMISDLRRCIRLGLIPLKDEPTLDQLGYYVEHKGKMGAISGENDDLVMALALAVQMATQQGAVLQRERVQEIAVQRTEGPPAGSWADVAGQFGDMDEWADAIEASLAAAEYEEAAA